MKIYALSDLHVDYPENLDWIMSLGEFDYRDDILILAGDVTHSLTVLSQILASLREKFRDVFFVPGNHELWVDEDDCNCSVEKYNAIGVLCEELGIQCKVNHYGGLSVVPLLGWYDFSFGEPDRHLRRAWRDFKSCRWPSQLQDVDAVNDFFLAKNEPLLSTTNDMVVSFSHFLPRIDVMPAQIPEKRRAVYPVLGSTKLGQQVQQLNPDIHIYGHSHVNQSIELNDIRFVNNAFAYPSEGRIARKALHCVWDYTESEHAAAE
ncbi:MAG: metallophosphoesterase [Proteobacteria bacterium]|nr:metallophosphoesterase [Pseudomonadota bacterium]